MSSRNGRALAAIAGALAIAIGGCGGGPTYPLLPRAVRLAVRQDFPDCRPREMRGPLRSDGLHELRGCGLDLLYACGPGRDRREECTLITPDDATAGGARAPSPSELALAAEVVSLGEARAGDGTGDHIAATVGGAVLTLAVPFLGFGFGGLAFLIATCGYGPCPEYQDWLVIGGSLTIALSTIGLVVTTAGAVSWGLADARERERAKRITDACSAISFRAGVTGLAASICFP